MIEKLREPRDDLRGINRLVINGIAGGVDVVAAMHYNISSIPGLAAKPKRERTNRPHRPT